MELLSGNEAIAQGAWEAGVHVGVAYPGTPSTETMEAFATKPEVYAEWCPNEKVALETGIGASAAGARVLVTMKHVGVNVAADPLFTAAYTGVGGGLVILAADDPGMHSSQNEQDSRFYALAARIPMLEPSDSHEALAYTTAAYDISEQFDVPVMIRSTVRISHTKTLTEVGSRTDQAIKPYEKDVAKWVMMPAFAKGRRDLQDERCAALVEWANSSDLNRVEYNDRTKGIICSGATYQHVVEALPEASILKLGVVWPLAEGMIRDFAEMVDELYVVEEASDYLSGQVKALGLELSYPDHPLPLAGELTPNIIKRSFGLALPDHLDALNGLPPRPPALCAGCPHRLVFKELGRMKAIVTGDIGCYTLGALQPLAAIDTCVDMGASISMAHGIELVLSDKEDKRPIVGVIGDSTFGHSGVTSLMNTVYNQGSGCVVILDNRTTAMTGRQGNPFNGVTLQNRPSRELNIEEVVRALGVEDVATVDPHDAKAVRAALKQATADEGLSVVVFRAPCVLLDRVRNAPYISTGNCTSCGVCVSLGCPAISKDASTGQAHIDQETCIGCGQCIQYCKFDAIEQLTTESRG